ncbi:hypothetical protein ACO2Q7_02420 [Rathayibacter sp. KR2-224]|uniref:hypothetical protein n=1 Tax=Rathayibacter sp. KR2-224 TaxID=3400913 RepID=UPI003C04DB6F
MTLKGAGGAHVAIGQQRLDVVGCSALMHAGGQLAEQVQRVGKHIDVNVFDPGEMPGTGFSRSFPAPMRLFAKYVNYVSVPFRRGVHTPSQSARALAALATSPAFAGVTGKYFDGTEQKASSDLSYDVENRKDLWRTSIELSGITAAETILKLE